MNVTFSIPRVFRVALAIIFVILGYNNIVQFLPQETLDLPARYFLGFIGTYAISLSVGSSCSLTRIGERIPEPVRGGSGGASAMPLAVSRRRSSELLR